MKVHPAAELFPMLDDGALAELAEDIRTNGLRHPIVVDADNVLLDGRNRLKACGMVSVKPQYEVWDGDGSVVGYIISANLKRRQLTKHQQSCLAVELEPLLEVEVAQRKGGRPANGAGKPTQKIADVSRREQDNRTTAALAGQLAGGVNRTYVLQAKKLQATSPKTFEQVKAGRLSLPDARREVAREQRQKTATEVPWPKAECELRAALERGETVVINVDKQPHVTSWAERGGLLIMIDRTSPWGNPFLLGDDGSRDEVCDAYAKHYLPHKPSLLKKLRTLKGRALGCHCAPQRCHGDAIAKAGATWCLTI